MPTLRCYIITHDEATSDQMRQYIERTPMLECAGVFASGSEAFAGIAAGVADYLMTPVSYERFALCANRLLSSNMPSVSATDHLVSDDN